MVARYCRTRANDGAALLSAWSACRVAAILPQPDKGRLADDPSATVHPFERGGEKCEIC